MTETYDPLASVQAAGPPGTISFIYGLPDPATFPVDDLRDALDSVLCERPQLALQYSPEQGYGPLIDYLRDKLRRDEDLTLGRTQLMLTGGSSQALDHLCTLLTNPGDTVLVEAPTYHDSIHSLLDHGLRPVQVSTDDGGIILETLAERLETLSREGRPARMLYVIPSFQNPSGVTLAADRRRPLVDFAEEHDLLIVEDDVYRDLAFEGQVPSSLFALDSSARVLRLGSFSKILAPALRLGWLVGPPALVQRFIDSGFRCMGGGASPLIANAVANYCQRHLLEPHIQALREQYRRRRDSALAALESHMPEGVDWSRPAGGCFIWLRLPDSLDARETAARSKEEGVWILPGHQFFTGEPTGQYLRLAYSYVPEAEIGTGIETLGRVLRSQIRD